MKKRRYHYRYSTCSNKLQKRGLTAVGAQRWLCVACRKSATKPRAN